jgi:hypothetical protein
MFVYGGRDLGKREKKGGSEASWIWGYFPVLCGYLRGRIAPPLQKEGSFRRRGRGKIRALLRRAYSGRCPDQPTTGRPGVITNGLGPQGASPTPPILSIAHHPSTSTDLLRPISWPHPPSGPADTRPKVPSKPTPPQPFQTCLFQHPPETEPIYSRESTFTSASPDPAPSQSGAGHCSTSPHPPTTTTSPRWSSP